MKKKIGLSRLLIFLIIVFIAYIALDLSGLLSNKPGDIPVINPNSESQAAYEAIVEISGSDIMVDGKSVDLSQLLNELAGKSLKEKVIGLIMDNPKQSTYSSVKSELEKEGFTIYEQQK